MKRKIMNFSKLINNNNRLSWLSTKWIFYDVFVYILVLTVYTDAVFMGKDLLLSELVSYYEPLKYSSASLAHAHNRMRRSLLLTPSKNNDDKKLLLNFTAHNQIFNLSLRREKSLFSNNLFIKNNLAGIKSRTFHPSNIYEGVVLDDPSSSCHGFIHDNIFEGRIKLRNGIEYIIESAKQYTDLDHEKSHSVIYRVKDMIHNRHRPYHCGVTDANSNSLPILKLQVNPFMQLDNAKIKFNSVSRKRRSVNNSNIRKPTKRVCEMHVRADPSYLSYVKNDESRAMYLISQHIKSVANMFKNIDFDGDGEPDGYTLAIKKLDSMDISKCGYNLTHGNCMFAVTNLGAAKFLDLVSTEDNSDYCLSYVFTHRNFDDGILGLAFTSSTESEKRGGICDSYRYVEGVKKTLNTGIISNTVYGQTVIPKITDLIVAHEIAHSFGAKHDAKNNRVCAPAQGSGNYLMYSQAQYGTDRNNVLLSPCSKSSIFENLQRKSEKCFTEPGHSICGNKIVEPGEECDCGYRDEESCNRDPCCKGANRDGHFGCKFSVKARKVANRCSPSQGLCCNPATCQPYGNDTAVCNEATDECTKPSKCIDRSYKCQNPEIVADKSFCNDNNNVCTNGKCLGSLCSLIPNKVDCQCTGVKDVCKLCCQDIGNSSSCRVFKWSGHSVIRPVGSPCNQFEGRCNRLSECQRVNEDGILSRLKKFLFPHSTLVNIYRWAQNNWWACVLIGLASLLFIIAFVCTCKRCVPSDSKRIRKPSHPFLCISSSPEPSDERSPSSRSNSSARNYIRTPTDEPPPRYDDSPPGYNTALRENLRYPPSYELEIIR